MGPKCFDTSRPKFINTLRSKCADSSYKQYIIEISDHFGTENYAWKYDIVKNLRKFCKFFFYEFLGPKCFGGTNIYTTVK